MKGLFIKDWRLMSRQMKLMLVFVLVFVGMFSYTMEDSLALTGFYTVIFLMLSVNCFAYDETCHFDKLAAAAPIPKSRVVLTRYLAALAVGAVGMASNFSRASRPRTFSAICWSSPPVPLRASFSSPSSSPSFINSVSTKAG